MARPNASDLIEAVEDALIDQGPLAMDELVDVLRAAGFTFSESPEDDLFDEIERYNSDDMTTLLDGRWAHVRTLLEGRVFTHRLTRDEIEQDVLPVYPDLVPVLWWEDPIIKTSPDPFGLDSIASLPAGTLAELGVQEGDLIGLTVTTIGYDLDRVEEHEVTAHSEKFRRWWLGAVSGPKPQELELSLLTVCADVFAAFATPNPPLAEYFAELGLVQDGDWVAPAGFDFQTYRAKGRVDRIAEDHELSEEEALCVAGLFELHRRLNQVSDPTDFALIAAGGSADPDAPPLPATPMANHLREPAVATAFLEETLGHEEEGAETLARMVEILEEKATRTARPALRWLRSRAYERLGRVAEAEECLHQAERLDPDWPLTLLDLARYASDRGDAAQGLALLARADPYVDDDLKTLLERFLPRPGPVVGRNEPCWCGSGRKFKQCHLHKPATPPLEERAAWLYQKAGRFILDGRWLSMVYELSMERAAYAEDEDDVRAAAEDPLVGDLVLFEGEALLAFVAERGFLLPDDELRLAEQWMFIQRSVFEITAVQRGEGFTARDLLTGDRQVVRDRTASRYVKPGLLIFARILPVGETMQVFGGIEPVALADRDPLLSLLDDGCEPGELVAFLTRRFAPPTLVNTDGDPLVFREVVLRVSDPEVLSIGLDAAYRRLEETEPPEWLHERTIDGLERICARLRLTDAELQVETAGDQRMDEVLETVRELDPLASVVVAEREPMSDTREAAQIAAKRPSTGGEFIAPEDQPPEIQAAMAEHMGQYERRWLDRAIPALNGLTPRQAAADPTRRGDLRQLLASFDDGGDSPTLMSARRLRTALGLEQ